MKQLDENKTFASNTMKYETSQKCLQTIPINILRFMISEWWINEVHRWFSKKTISSGQKKLQRQCFMMKTQIPGDMCCRFPVTNTDCSVLFCHFRLSLLPSDFVITYSPFYIPLLLSLNMHSTNVNLLIDHKPGQVPTTCKKIRIFIILYQWSFWS